VGSFRIFIFEKTSWMRARTIKNQTQSRTLQRDCAGKQVTSIFGSSMEVLISVHGETPAARELVHCGSAYATVVSVNRAGDPVPVPFHIAPVSDVEKLRCQVRNPASPRQSALHRPSDPHQLMFCSSGPWSGPPAARQCPSAAADPTVLAQACFCHAACVLMRCQLPVHGGHRVVFDS